MKRDTVLVINFDSFFFDTLLTVLSDLKIPTIPRYGIPPHMAQNPSRHECTEIKSIEDIIKLEPCGIILSGSSIFNPAKKWFPVPPNRTTVKLGKIVDNSFRDFLIQTKIPTLGLCYSHEMLNAVFGGFGNIQPEENGVELLTSDNSCELFEGLPPVFPVWIKHKFFVTDLGTDLICTGSTNQCIIAAFRHQNLAIPIYGLQFHPESPFCPQPRIFQNFYNLCKRTR
jgi:GMP synthase-like glutamine amidotransferase